MRESEMDVSARLDIAREILNWDSYDDSDKNYFLKSFILGWSDSEDIHKLTSRDAGDKRPKIKQEQLQTLADVECELTHLAHDIEESDGESIITRRLDKIVSEIENIFYGIQFTVT